MELEEGQSWRIESERLPVAAIVKRNGAYLVSMYLTAETEDSTPDAMYDCAGSLVVAKRVAREMATQFGYKPAWRWSRNEFGNWTLEALIVRRWAQWDD